MNPMNSLGPVIPLPVEGAGARSGEAADVSTSAPPAVSGTSSSPADAAPGGEATRPGLTGDESEGPGRVPKVSG